MEVIRHNKPYLGAEEGQAVARVLATGWIDEGPVALELEKALASYLGGGGALMLSSGTAALFLSLKVMGVGAGDQVILPTYVCSALLNAVYMSGAEPVLVDVLESDFNLDPVRVAASCTGKTKAIVAPHIFGFPADLRSLTSLGIPVIEDAAQALGAKYAGKPVGSWGACSVFSFYATKVITGGQGGMLFSSQQDLIERARDYREFDCRESYYPRFNFKMTDIQAALVRCQFSRLQDFADRRRQISERYRAVLAGRVRFQEEGPEADPLFYRFVIRTGSRESRDRLKGYLSAEGIETIVPIERHELLHRYLDQNPEGFPVSEQIVDETLSLPIYPALQNEEISRVCSALEGAFL